MEHLTQRVAWHDQRWNGKICNAPSANAFCVMLDEVRKHRDDSFEDAIAGKPWADLDDDTLPPCVAQAAGFMSAGEWHRVVRHPYQSITKAAATHGHLLPTPVKVDPYSFFAVPFWWMLRENGEQVDRAFGGALPADERPPMSSAWVFGRERQRAISDSFFGRLTPGQSLVFFYTKEGHPLGEAISRLVVGVGNVTSIGRLLEYHVQGSKPTYPLWDRMVRHSVRDEGVDGFLLPYHEYLAPTGNHAEDERRRELLSEIIVRPEQEEIRGFSYMSELIQSDTALSVLLRCLDAVRAVRRHGIASGPWLEREEWLNQQIAQLWTDRGSFPGLGSALEALGLRMGTALAYDLLRTNAFGLDDDPWSVIDELLRGQRSAPTPYWHDIEATRGTWLSLTPERRTLLHLLSRFALLPEQAARWYAPEKRASAGIKATDANIIENPYRLAELDTGGRDSSPLSLGVIDRGLLPDSAAANRFPIPEPSFVGSPRDPRRIRAAIVAVLRQAATEGDSLLVADELVRRVSGLGLRPDPDVTLDWVYGNRDLFHGVIESLELSIGPGKPPVQALQLTPLKEREDLLRRNLLARARRRLTSLDQDWVALLRQSIGANVEIDTAAVAEQAEALERVTTSKLSLLLGRAGTGKTSTLGALLRCRPLLEAGALLLAPTGKARVKMAQASGRDAKTVAQFLYQQGMYDPVRQVPRFEAKEPYKGARTVIIDECSMLTMDDLAAVLKALDLGHVERIILVGDPNQLPPIGVGRPFADLAGYVDSSGDADLERAMAKLTHEVRTVQHERSDSLRLAAWFMRGEQAPGADQILVDLESGGTAFNDLSVRTWKTPDDLRAALLDEMQAHLGIQGPGDVAGFDRALGLDERSFANFEDPGGAERFQVLSPVRMHEHGVAALNRWMQRGFRGARLASARRPPRKVLLGDEEIGRTDKVIQIRNEVRQAYHWDTRKTEDLYIANGEVGVAVQANDEFLNVLFADRPNTTFGYHRTKDVRNGVPPLELAYALTVHKAQGSEFKVVFVVIPERTRLLRRELLYTALTRSSERLVLLVQGDNPGWLFDLSKPAMSETLRRNTNLFVPAVRLALEELPYAEHLIHRADDGTMVRSKSELVIANKLIAMGIPFRYEEFLTGTEGTRVLPDFTFVDAAGDRVVWEHLGMLGREDYRRSWEWKLEWYQRNGFVEDRTLFTTRDDERGGLDSAPLTEVANRIQTLL